MRNGEGRRLNVCALLGHYAVYGIHFLPTFLDNLSVPSWPLKMGPIGCPETSVRNYQYTLHNVPEERSSHLLRGGSLKSHKIRLSKYEILSKLEQFRNYKNSFILPRKYLLWKRVYRALNRYAGFIWLSFKSFIATVLCSLQRDARETH